MKKILSYLMAVLFTAACSNHQEETSAASENDADAARNFIRAALDGDYDQAKTYMLQDSLNTQLLNTFKDNYRTNMSREDKRGYREASIRIPDIKKISDSESVVVYSNSYMNKPDSLKVIRRSGQWLVDFKYSFGSKDSLP